MTTLPTSREAFEQWFLGDNPTMTNKRAIERKSNGGYILMKTLTDWRAWQASEQRILGILGSEETRKAIAKEIAEFCGVDWQDEPCYEAAVAALAAIIEKVKP